MGKRIYQIAKELGKENKQVLDDLKKIGIEKKTSSNSLTEEEEKKLKEFYSEKPSKQKHIDTKKGGKKEKKEVKKEKIETKKEEIQKKKRDKKYFEKGKESGKIVIYEGITVKELAEKMGMKAKDLIQKLLQNRMLLTVNKSLSMEEAEKILEIFGFEGEKKSFETKIMDELSEERDESNLVERAPLVTVMGHVDHGKTTLLDALRNTKVADREKGGITQHIGASKIKYKGKEIVFIDTPGHEAFARLRLRGANVTDIVILVVAADDGVMPQTIEAISHTKTAGVPIIVAINKIDKPEANPMKVKQELLKHGITVEDYGGDVVSVEISAKKRIGLDELLEMILLVAEMNELKGDPNIPAKGYILEARLDTKKGSIADVIIKEGVVKLGDPFISGTTYGKVRSIEDEHGRRLKEARMVAGVEISGFNETPKVGELFQVVPSLEKAQQIAELRKEKLEEERRKKLDKRLSLDEFFKKMKGEGVKKLPLIIKADVEGSLEAIEDSLNKIKHQEVQIDIIQSSTGAVSESDVLLASTANAIIICYNVRANKRVREIAKNEKVEIRFYSIIYQLLDDIKASLEGILSPIEKETFLGAAEVRKVFKVPKVGTVAGCYVSEGKIENDANIRVVRNGVVIFTGELESLKHYTKDVSVIKNGQECGIKIRNFNDIKQGDVLEAFKIEKIKQKI